MPLRSRLAALERQARQRVPDGALRFGSAAEALAAIRAMPVEKKIEYLRGRLIVSFPPDPPRPFPYTLEEFRRLPVDEMKRVLHQHLFADDPAA